MTRTQALSLYISVVVYSTIDMKDTQLYGFNQLIKVWENPQDGKLETGIAPKKVETFYVTEKEYRDAMSAYSSNLFFENYYQDMIERRGEEAWF